MRTVLPDLPFEVGTRQEEVLSPKITGADRWPFHRRSKSTAEVKQRTGILRQYRFRRKSSEIKDTPKTIASSREVLSECGRAHPRIDSAEHYAQAVREDIRKTPNPSGI